jgi:hypothetical protein
MFYLSCLITKFNYRMVIRYLKLTEQWSATVFNLDPKVFLLFIGVTATGRPGPLHYRVFTITLRNTTLGRTSMHE